jgi:hypothetical protein
VWLSVFDDNKRWTAVFSHPTRLGHRRVASFADIEILVILTAGDSDHNRQGCNMGMARVLVTLLEALGAGLALGVFCFLLYLAGCQHGHREATPEVSCQQNLELLGKGIAGYRNVHGELPQRFVGPEGDEHSWRTLVVPYVLPGRSPTSYQFDEPWDSQNNRKAFWPGFLESFVHRCPLDPAPIGDPFFTSYLMLVRPPVKDSETGETRAATLANDAVLIVESVDSGIGFAEPRDLPWEDLWSGDSAFGKGKLNARHSKVVKALRVDGKVIDIPRDISEENLRKLLGGS